MARCYAKRLRLPPMSRNVAGPGLAKTVPAGIAKDDRNAFASLRKRDPARSARQADVQSALAAGLRTLFARLGREISLDSASCVGLSALPSARPLTARVRMAAPSDSIPGWPRQTAVKSVPRRQMGGCSRGWARRLAHRAMVTGLCKKSPATQACGLGLSGLGSRRANALARYDWKHSSHHEVDAPLIMLDWAEPRAAIRRGFLAGGRVNRRCPCHLPEGSGIAG